MKFIHTSDLHIGKRVNGMSMLQDQRHILEQILSIVQCERADALVIAGDIYDRASPSAEAVAMLDVFLTKLVGMGVRVLAVPGNHDSAERVAYVQGLLEHQGVHFPPVYEGELDKVVLEDEFGEVAFWLLPYLKPGDVRRFFPDADIGDDYSAALRAVLGACEVDRDVRNVIIAHQLVTAGSNAPERADEEIRLGGIDNVDVSVFDAFDYVALGHVHRPQRVGRDTVRYSGSPLKYSFSETRYDKSVVVVELGAKGLRDGLSEGDACVAFKLVALEPLHDMREARTSLAELLEQGRAQGPETRDYLHVVLTDELPQLDDMSRIRELFPNTMMLDYEGSALAAVSQVRTRQAVDPEQADMEELFAAFYEEQVGKAMDAEQRDMLARIVHQVEEDVARGENADAAERGG